MAPWTMPEPLLPIAVVAKTRSDEDALAKNLARLVAGDPTLRLERNPETHQLVLWCMGESHADVVLDRLRVRRRRAGHRAGQGVAAGDVRRARPRATAGTSSSPAATASTRSATSRWSRCRAASGFEFVDKVVGGAVPHNYIPSVEKGVRAQLERGIVAGYPVVDLRVTLVDGKAHSVDSSDAAFQTAGALALREAAEQGQVDAARAGRRGRRSGCRTAYVGAVMSDLSGRRGRLLGTETDGDGEHSLVRAEVPATELVRYAVELRAMTSGAATFTRTYARHEPMPAHLADAVKKEATAR